MAVTGDLLVYRGVEPVGGTVRSYSDQNDIWSVIIELERPVSSLYRVRFGWWDCLDVEFYGRTLIKAIVPDTARRGSGAASLQDLLLEQTLAIDAEARFRSLTAPAGSKTLTSMALGFGVSPRADDGLEEALQRAIRFLMISRDPLDDSRGGGLRAIHRRPLISEAVARRMVSMACQRYNRYAPRIPTGVWKVEKIIPGRVKFTSAELLQQELGQTMLSRELGVSPDGTYDGTERVLSIGLKHTISQAGTTLEAASALSF